MISLLIQKLVLLQNSLSKFATVLEIPDQLEHKIIILSQNVHTLNQLLSILSIIPALKTPISLFQKVLGPIDKTIGSVRDKISKMDNTYVDPVRSEIQEFNERISHGVDSLKLLDKKFSSLPTDVQKKANSSIEILVNLIDVLEKPIVSLSNSKLVDMLVEVENLLETVNVLDVMMRPVEKALDVKISIPYSVKVKVPKTKKVKDWKSFWNFVWKEVQVWEWEIKTVNYTFTVREIIKGVDVIREVLDLLEKEVDKVMDPVLKGLGLDVEIPGLGLDGVEKEIGKLLGVDLEGVKKVEKALEEVIGILEG